MPLVSAIMPTRERPEMSRACVECWRSQTWPETELLILDDGDAPSFPRGLVEGARIRYYQSPERLTIGAKRNLACELAQGEFIVHFDSDDFYAPERIADQVQRLQESGKAVTGYTGIRFTDGVNWWKNTNAPGGYGASLCYRKAWWENHRFPYMQTGEDWSFVERAMYAKEFISSDAGELMYARNHAGNTDQRVMGEGWVEITGTERSACN